MSRRICGALLAVVCFGCSQDPPPTDPAPSATPPAEVSETDAAFAELQEAGLDVRPEVLDLGLRDVSGEARAWAERSDASDREAWADEAATFGGGTVSSGDALSLTVAIEELIELGLAAAQDGDVPRATETWTSASNLCEALSSSTDLQIAIVGSSQSRALAETLAVAVALDPAFAILAQTLAPEFDLERRLRVAMAAAAEAGTHRTHLESFQSLPSGAAHWEVLERLQDNPGVLRDAALNLIRAENAWAALLAGIPGILDDSIQEGPTPGTTSPIDGAPLSWKRLEAGWAIATLDPDAPDGIRGVVFVEP